MSEAKLTIIEDEKPSLEKAQGLVGGLVELISLNNGNQLLVNESALFEDLPVNEQATNIALSQSQALIQGGIFGDAVLLKGDAKWID